MKVGSLVYSTAQGLGYLGKALYDAGVITDVLVIAHGRHKDEGWYPDSERIGNLRDPKQVRKIRTFCESMDIMLFLETPFDWGAMAVSRKSVLMTMYECTHEKLPAVPDAFLCPSKLDYRVFAGRYPDKLATGHLRFLPVGVDVPWKLRTEAKVFVHNSGHGGLKGRNGTKEVLEAWQYVKSDARLIVRSQSHLGIIPRHILKDSRVDLIHGSQEYTTLYDDGDVFLFPECFNGLSLPLQEARAAGMLVMCGDRFPMNGWLPTRHGVGGTWLQPLIPVSSVTSDRIGPPYIAFDRSHFDPKQIAAKVDEWYGKDISEYSRSGREWAETMSWKVLAPLYREMLEGWVRE